MLSNANMKSTLQATWDRTQGRFEAYRPLLPGDPAFTCQPDVCDAHCCRAFSVALDDADVSRLERFSGGDPSLLLEVVDGEPLTLPISTPYLLRRREGRCDQLQPHRSCGIYDGRPAACRLYPHQIFLIEPDGSLAWREDADGTAAALAAVLAGDLPAAGPLPVLTRHIECPGFTGPAHTVSTWQALVREIAALQFPELELPS